jgi:hypothetical protein
MIHTFKVSLKGDLSACVAGSILALIQETVDVGYEITLVYSDRIVDARQIVSWLEFAFREYDDFTVETDFPGAEDLIKDIQNLIDSYHK